MSRLNPARALSRRTEDLLRLIGRRGSEGKAEAFLVGGPVRDLLMKRGTIDLDIAVVGDGVGFARRLARELEASIRVHEAFHTASLELPSGVRIDVASTRKETYERPGALPRVEPASIEQDLSRRDFTVNSMAVSLGPADFGALLDPFGGSRDLGARLLRVLHPASFRDDPTRILRLARFAARFGFRPEALTERLMREALSAGAIQSISRDRLRQEIMLLLADQNPAGALEKLRDWGILAEVLPGVTPDAGFRRAALRARDLPSAAPDDAKGARGWVPLVLLMRAARPGVINAVANRLNLGGRVRRFVEDAGKLRSLTARVRKAERQSELKRVLDAVAPELRLAMLALMPDSGPRRRLSRYLGKGARIRPSLSGNDLLKMGYKPGPRMRVILNALLEEKLDGRLKDGKAEARFVAARFPLSRGENSA